MNTEREKQKQVVYEVGQHNYYCNIIYYYSYLAGCLRSPSHILLKIKTFFSHTLARSLKQKYKITLKTKAANTSAATKGAASPLSLKVFSQGPLAAGH